MHRRGNNITLEVEFKEHEIESIIEFLTKLWKYIGMEGTPDRDVVINRNRLEEETILLMRKLGFQPLY